MKNFIEAVRAAVESSMPAIQYDKSPHEKVMLKIQQLLGTVPVGTDSDMP
jgi:hypothetical protein